MQNESKEALSKRNFEDVIRFYFDSKSKPELNLSIIKRFIEEELAGLGSSDVEKLPIDLKKKIVFDVDLSFRKKVLFPNKDKELELLDNLND